MENREIQITFEQYKKLLVRLDKIEFNYDNYYHKYYILVKERDRHIKDLQSEIRFLRRKILRSEVE